MLTFITGCAGSGKTKYIYDTVKRLYDSGNNNMVLFVPEQSSLETEKDLLDILGDSGQYAVEPLSFERFCNRLDTLYKYEKKQRISDTGRCVMMSAALRECKDKLEIFSGRADDFGFAKLLIDLYEQIKTFGRSSEELYSASDKFEHILSAKLHDIGLIFAQYESMLGGEYFDPSDRLTRAISALDEYPYFSGKTVFFDSFKGFTSQQMKLVEKIIASADDVYFAFCCDEERNDVCSPFTNIKSLITQFKSIARSYSKSISPIVRLGEPKRPFSPEIEFIEKNLYTDDKCVYDDECENIRIIPARDIYDEADLVAKEIHRLIRTQGYRFRDFAVVARSIDDYLPALEAAFERRNITYYADKRRTVVLSGVFRFARYALKAANSLSTDDIIGLLKTGLCGLEYDKISDLENYTDIWQIDKGWSHDWSGNPEGAFAFDDRSTAKLRAVNETRKAISIPLYAFSKVLSDSETAGEKCAALFDFAEKMNIGKNLYKLSAAMEQNGNIELAADERRCYDMFIGVLDQIYMSVGDAKVNNAEFESLFDTAASACDFGSIPQKLDEVRIGSADRIRPKSPKITFIMGTNFGVFPKAPGQNPFFTKPDLDALESIGCGISGDGISESVDERYLVYTLLCSACDKLYVSYSENDLGGQALESSEIVKMLITFFGEKCFVSSKNQIENECDARRSLYRTDSSDYSAVMQFVNNGGLISKFIKPQENDCRLSRSTAERCFGDKIMLSASKIDVYHQCRFRYLCQYVLKLKPLKKAEIDVMERGTIVHYVLEKTVIKYADDPKSALELSEDRLIAEIHELVNECVEGYSKGRQFTKTEIYSQNKLEKMLALLVRRIFTELSNTKFKVMQTELAIGDIGDKEDHVPAIEADIGNGRRIVVVGVIDRADVFKSEKGDFVRIIDYKTGTKTLELSDVVNGCNIQMLLYMSALIRYMRTSGKSAFPAGVYYLPAKSEYVSAEKNSDSKTQKQLDDKLRCVGMTADNEEVIDALDETEDKRFAPIKYKKGVPDPEKSFNEHQFELIAGKIDEIIKNMGNGLFFSDFIADPVCLDKNRKTVCDYCDYRSVCGRQPDEALKTVRRKKNSEILSELEKGE